MPKFAFLEVLFLTWMPWAALIHRKIILKRRLCTYNKCGNHVSLEPDAGWKSLYITTFSSSQTVSNIQSKPSIPAWNCRKLSWQTQPHIHQLITFHHLWFNSHPCHKYPPWSGNNMQRRRLRCLLLCLLGNCHPDAREARDSAAPGS